MAERRFIERREEAEVTVIDKTVRNKWSWKWTEKLVDGTILDLGKLGECIRKLPRAGLAYNIYRGTRVLFVVPMRCKLRESRLESHRVGSVVGTTSTENKTRKTNFSLPGMQCVFSAATWRDLLCQ